MQEKISHWIDILERIIKILRPQAYNTIAKWVVFSGIGLIVESQVNFAHALVVALFEEFIGKSEILRQVMISTNDPSLGIVLVICGMGYHLLVTLGKDYLDIKKAELPKHPDLQFSFSTQNKDKQENEFCLDGPRITLPLREEVPDYKEPKREVDRNISSRHSLFSMPPSIINMPGMKTHCNTRLYRDRVDLLNEWAGFEPLQIHLTNKGEVIANGLRVNLCIPKNDSLTLKEPSERLPSKPKNFVSEIVTAVQADIWCKLDRLQGKIHIKENKDHYEINWKIEKLQAGVVITGNKQLLIKLSKPVEIDCTIFCDDLPKPISSIFTLHPPIEESLVSLADVIDDDKFDALFEKHLAFFGKE
jgi:hypothetical protein